MKKWILYTLFIFVGGNCFAQTSEFEFQLYFEDAIGNKDTVTLGYDALATDTVDTAFGEVNILNQPWENGLDVRIGKSRFMPNSSPFLAKKQILKSFCIPPSTNYINNFSEEATIHFYTSNYPIRVKWDKTLFNNDPCIKMSIIYSEFHGFDIGGYMLLGNPVQDSIIIDSTLVNVMGYTLESYTETMKKIGILNFRFGQDNPLGLYSNTPFITNIFPNPISNGSILTVNTIGSYQILNELGMIVQEGTISENTIPISMKHLGVYILNIKTINSIQKNFKIVVK